MSNESGGVERLGLPIILLSAVWGAFDVILKSIEMQNKIRDAAMVAKTFEERRHIFWSDWIGIWMVTLWFLVLLTIVIYQLPRFLHSGAAEFKSHKNLCCLVATLPGFAFIGSLIGGIIDIPVFFKH